VFALVVIAKQYQMTEVLGVFSNRMLTGIGVAVFFTAAFGVMAFLMDFTRAYIMGLVFGTGIAAAMIFGSGVWMVLAGLPFVIRGIGLFISFLREYPVPGGDHEFQRHMAR